MHTIQHEEAACTFDEQASWQAQSNIECMVHHCLLQLFLMHAVALHKVAAKIACEVLHVRRICGFTYLCFL